MEWTDGSTDDAKTISLRSRGYYRQLFHMNMTTVTDENEMGNLGEEKIKTGCGPVKLSMYC